MLATLVAGEPLLHKQRAGWQAGSTSKASCALHLGGLVPLGAGTVQLKLPGPSLLLATGAGTTRATPLGAFAIVRASNLA